MEKKKGTNITILVDNREQTELIFNHSYIEAIEHTTLNVGDYGCRLKNNYVVPLYFERKELGDLFGSLTTGYKRFKREIQRAQMNKVTLFIVIEGTISKILKGYKYSTVEGISILRKLLTLYFRYGVPFHFFKDRNEMSIYIAESFVSAGREYLQQIGKSRLETKKVKL